MSRTKPFLGFVGTGWIGLKRMEAIFRSGIAHPECLVFEPSDEMAQRACAIFPRSRRLDSLESLLALRPDGVVIASPSALHASQAITALEAGCAVFCQKPLGRGTPEVDRVLIAAQQANRLLDVDFSYRHTEAVQRIREILRQREAGIGRVFSIDLTFHNAYGPDKPWFYDRTLSGGGCVMDLGVHLVDLALWLLNWPEVHQVSSRLYHRGKRLVDDGIEDYAIATLDVANDVSVRIACSWNLPAGQDAEISIRLYGEKGGLHFCNVNGSFYDFIAERYNGTQRETLCTPPDAWGGRAAVHWLQQLQSDPAYRPEIEKIREVSRTLDRIYAPMAETEQQLLRLLP